MTVRRTICLVLAIASVSLCGCLSVVRIPMPHHERYSDEGVCTNRVWTSFLESFPKYRVYTTVKMRCRVTGEWLKPIPPDLKGEMLHHAIWFKRLGWMPLLAIWITSPVDAAVDTLFLPYDLYMKRRTPEASLDESSPRQGRRYPRNEDKTVHECYSPRREVQRGTI